MNELITIFQKDSYDIDSFMSVINRNQEDDIKKLMFYEKEKVILCPKKLNELFKHIILQDSSAKIRSLIVLFALSNNYDSQKCLSNVLFDESNLNINSINIFSTILLNDTSNKFFNSIKSNHELMKRIIYVIKSYLQISTQKEIVYESIFDFINKIIETNNNSGNPLNQSEFIFFSNQLELGKWENYIQKNHPKLLPFEMRIKEYEDINDTIEIHNITFSNRSVCQNPIETINSMFEDNPEISLLRSNITFGIDSDDEIN